MYSIGHGKKPIAEFIRQLQGHQVVCLIDVRSVPWSRWNPQYNQPALTRELNEYGIEYFYLGDALGGYPIDDTYRDADGFPDFGKMAENPAYKSGISRLREIENEQLNAAIMCSESKPEECHRARLIGVTLNNLGIELRHILDSETFLLQRELDLSKKLRKKK